MVAIFTEDGYNVKDSKYMKSRMSKKDTDKKQKVLK